MNGKERYEEIETLIKEAQRNGQHIGTIQLGLRVLVDLLTPPDEFKNIAPSGENIMEDGEKAFIGHNLWGFTVEKSEDPDQIEILPLPQRTIN